MARSFKRKTLREAIESIDEAIATDGPYTHNLISVNLRIIADRYGDAAANKVVRDKRLTEHYGIRPTTNK